MARRWGYSPLQLQQVPGATPVEKGVVVGEKWWVWSVNGRGNWVAVVVGSVLGAEMGSDEV